MSNTITTPYLRVISKNNNKEEVINTAINLQEKGFSKKPIALTGCDDEALAILHSESLQLFVDIEERFYFFCDSNTIKTIDKIIESGTDNSVVDTTTELFNKALIPAQ